MNRILAVVLTICLLGGLFDLWSGWHAVAPLSVEPPPSPTLPHEIEAARGTLAAGDDHFLILARDGASYGWGRNDNMELGLLAHPAQPDDAQAVHNFAWGQLWRIKSATTPTRLPGEMAFRTLFAGDNASYAIDDSGQSWRHPHPKLDGVQGDAVDVMALMEKRLSRFSPFDAQIRWQKIGTDGDIGAGIDAEGRMRFWRESALPLVSESNDPPRYFPANPDNRWLDFCQQMETVWAVAADGSLWKHAGPTRLPFGAEADAGVALRLDFVPVTAPSQFRRVICRSNAHDVLLLDNDRHLWGFGRNDHDALGIGDGNPYTASKEVPETAIRKLGDRQWAEVVLGTSPSFTLAIAADGSLWGWGYSLGAGGNNRETPTPIDSSHRWLALAASQHAAAAVTDRGELFTWGEGEAGVFADGGIATRRGAPQQVAAAVVWGRLPTTAAPADTSPAGQIRSILEREVASSGLGCMRELFRFPFSSRAAQADRDILPCNRCNELAQAGLLEASTQESFDGQHAEPQRDTRFELTTAGRQAYVESSGEHGYGRICLGKARLYRIDTIAAPLRMGSQTIYSVAYTVELAAPHPAAFTEPGRKLGIELPAAGAPALYPPHHASVVFEGGNGYLDETLRVGAQALEPKNGS